MEALFLKILSFILSAMMFMYSGISSVFPWILPDEPVQNEAVICDGSHFDFEGDTAVISDYVTWIQTAESEKFTEYDWTFFFNRNLALVKVTVPVGGELTVDSAEENGETLDVEYTVRFEKGKDSENAVSVIVVATSKAVNTVNVKENIDAYEVYIPEAPLAFEGYNYRITDVDSFNDSYYYSFAENFSSYESWQADFTGADKNLTVYDEEYFKEKNIAVYYVDIPYENKAVRLCDVNEYSNYVDIDIEISDSEIQTSAKTVAVVLELSKEQTGKYNYICGMMDEAGVYPIEYFLKYTQKDEYVKVISDYDTWETYADTYYFLNDSNIITPHYFENKNIAMISLMLPTEDYSVKVEPLIKNGNSVEVVYSVSEREYASATMITYRIILAEISKDVTDIKVTQNGFKNRFKTTNTSNFNIEIDADPVLISDYDEWKSTVKNEVPSLKKYDENYFKNYSLVLIPETYSWYKNVEMKKLYENGDTVEILYGINGEIDGVAAAYVYDKTILIEVSKNIKNISVSNKNTENDFLQFKYSGPFSFSGDYIIISDYETWKTCADIEDERLAEYDEAYFDYNAVALIMLRTPNTDGIINPYYIYDEDGVLYFGYGINDNSVLPSLGFRTVLVEVSKDVTSIQTEKLS